MRKRLKLVRRRQLLLVAARWLASSSAALRTHTRKKTARRRWTFCAIHRDRWGLSIKMGMLQLQAPSLPLRTSGLRKEWWQLSPL